MVAWLEILRMEVAASNITAVAAKLGYARPTVSLVLKGDYNGSTDRIAAKVVEVFSDNVQCPHLKAPLTVAACHQFSTTPMPQSSATALRHWRACQCCEHAAQTCGVAS